MNINSSLDTAALQAARRPGMAARLATLQHRARVTVPGLVQAALDTGATIALTIETDQSAGAQDVTGTYADLAALQSAIESVAGVHATQAHGADLLILADTVGDGGSVEAVYDSVTYTGAGTDLSPAQIEIYDGTQPTPGDPAPNPVIVTVACTPELGTITDGWRDAARVVTLVVTTPLEGQITGADEATGTIPTWARLVDPTGTWAADLTVTVDGAGGELQLAQTGEEGGQPVARLFNGAFARISSFRIEG